jgi:hypothetical protein
MAEDGDNNGVNNDAKMTIASEMFEPYNAVLLEPDTHNYAYGTEQSEHFWLVLWRAEEPLLWWVLYFGRCSPLAVFASNSGCENPWSRGVIIITGAVTINTTLNIGWILDTH